MNQYMQLAYQEAHIGSTAGEGGPFGVVVTDAEGKVIAKAHNQVLLYHDPTAHAEIQAIRLAGQNLGTHNLSGCILYTTCEPCPMCLSAIIWAGIEQVCYALDRHDAAEIGFRDAMLYEYFQTGTMPGFDFQQMDREGCLTLFTEYRQQQGIIY